MITGRHVAITPALRQYIETKMRRFDRYGVRLTTLQVLLGVEKFRHVAEVIGVFHGRRLQAKASTAEMYGSIDLVMDKLETQIRKVKEKIVSHKTRSGESFRRPTTGISSTNPMPMEVLRPTLRVLSLDQAVAELTHAAAGVVVFQNVESGKLQILQRLPDGRISLIDPEQRLPASHART